MKDLQAVNEETLNEIETSVKSAFSEESTQNQEQNDEPVSQENPIQSETKPGDTTHDGQETTPVEQAEIQSQVTMEVETAHEPPKQVLFSNEIEATSGGKEPAKMDIELAESQVLEAEKMAVETEAKMAKEEAVAVEPEPEKVEEEFAEVNTELDHKEEPTEEPKAEKTEVVVTTVEPEPENVEGEFAEVNTELVHKEEPTVEPTTEKTEVAATAVEPEPEKAEAEFAEINSVVALEEKQVKETSTKKEKVVSEDDDDDSDDIDENDITNYLEDDDDDDNEGAEKRVDYSVYSKEELINILSDKLENAPVQDIKYDVENIKSNFYKRHKADIDLAKKAFMTEGGDPALFVFEADPLEEKIKELFNEFRRLKAEFNKGLELEKEANLRKKYEIIEEIKELINGQESINKTFNDFRELQKKWRDIGLVPQAEVRNLWENYHHNIEQFYDYIKINRELRDLDLKKNLEQKIKLCEQSEELMMEPSVVKAFKQLQKLHDQWRDVGPVPEEQREDIWERFKSSTTYINKTHQDYFDNLKQEQTNNLNAKLALCEKAEELASLETDKHKDWEQYSDELIEVQKLWKTIGFATKKENNKIFERFRAACDLFFTKKRDFYFEHKEVQNNNYQLKVELCMQAESLKDSTDWKKTSNELIKLQKDWKEIGPVPRKISDEIWKRFRAACNEFFDRKEKYFSNIDKEYDSNLKAKEELIERVKNFVQLESIEENINQLKSFQNEWSEIGHVSFKLKDKIQKEFRDSVNAQFDKLKVDSDKRSVMVYKQRLENISQGTKANRQYRVEKDRLIETIRHLESDIVLLENNIGFFAKTKNAEALIKDVNNKIEKAKLKIKTEKQKLDMINKFE